MKKNILIIGVILLVIGIVLGALGPMLFTTSPQKLAADRSGSAYDHYSAGDAVTVYGKITYEQNVIILGGHIYELNGDGDPNNNDDFGFMSSTDVGDVGDTVLLKLQLKNVGSVEYWEETEKASPVPYMLPGILLAVIGGIMLLVGLVKKDGNPQPVQNQQYNPQYQQGQPYQQAEQAPPQYQQTAPPQPEYYQPSEENQGPPKF